MRLLRPLVALMLLACADGGAPTDATPTDVRPMAVQNGVDTEGLPDLIVDAKATRNNWLVRVEDFPAEFCSVQEGGVTPGTHTVLRFSVTTPNVGDADVFVGSPLAHMDPNGDGDYEDADGLFELASCHGHFHFSHYATYRLIDASGKEWRSAKLGFCMLDTDPYNVNSGDGRWNYRNCGSTARDGFQGISDGWADTYVWNLAGQYFVLDGGDEQDPVPPGTYTIRIEVNPAYPKENGVCPRVIDSATQLCHQFTESSYANNVAEVEVAIPEHPGRSGYGPLKGSPQVTAADEIDHRGK